MASAAVEHEFLPGALAIQERPPSPVGRAVLWTIVLFFMLAVSWAVFGRVDIVAVASGRIVPGDRVKRVQPLEKGVVQRILVEEGERVTAGQPLLELDATLNRASAQQLTDEIGALVLDEIRLGLLAGWLEAGEPNPEGSVEHMFLNQIRDHHEKLSHDPQGPAVQAQVSMLQGQWQAFRARQEQLKQQAAAQRAELRALSARVAKLRGILPLVTEKAAGARKLVDKDLLPEHRWLELEQQRIDTQQSLAESRAERQRAEAELAATLAEQRAHLASVRNEATSGLRDVRQKLSQRRQELVKVKRLGGLHVLKAPVSGVVQDLAVHTEGAVVTPAETLMRIVPKDDELTVEAWIRNRDIGFVEEGQSAEVKIDAFPFTKYGTIPGRIRSLADDAVNDEQHGLVFRALVDLDRDLIAVGERKVRLTPGMQVSVEARTGERRLIEYLLSPLLRYRQESMRER